MEFGLKKDISAIRRAFEKRFAESGLPESTANALSKQSNDIPAGTGSHHLYMGETSGDVDFSDTHPKFPLSNHYSGADYENLRLRKSLSDLHYSLSVGFWEGSTITSQCQEAKHGLFAHANGLSTPELNTPEILRLL